MVFVLDKAIICKSVRLVGVACVKCEAFSDVEGFLWRPPGATYATSSLGRKLGIGPRNYWFKTGLDAIKLHPEHTMTVLQGHGVGQVLIRDEDDQAQVEISGCVICNPDQEQSENFDVRVANPGLRPFGTFSSRNMIAAWILCIVLQFMLFRWSIHFEQHHSGWVDMLPWWRYVRLCAAGLKIVPTFGMFYAQSLWCKPKLSCLESALTMFSAVGVASVLWFWSDGKLALFPTYLAGYTGTFLGVGVCLSYAALLAANWTFVAAVFLPQATLLVEMGAVAVLRKLYCGLLWPLHSGEFAAEVGDQFGMVVPTCILLAHATAEGTRLAAMFAGAVTSQNYWWLGSAVNTLLLNLSARLGWSRFWAFKIMNALRGPTRLLFPTAWNVLHDHLKLFGGYCRFIPLWSLIFARAWAYGVSFEGAKAPAFNIPAAVAAVVLFLLEILEDLLIVHEVLPVAPIPEAVIQRHRSFGNNDPRQLFTMEMRPNVSNLSKSLEAVSLGKSHAFKPVVPSSELLDHMVAESAVGPRRSHSKLRAWLGQERYLTPSLLLHGLRPMPFFCTASLVLVMAELTYTLFNSLLGPGFLLGVVEEPCPRAERLQRFWMEDLPLSC
eukprot:symbB.v1.2.034903.t1/scaffold4589.1/size37648/5